MKKKSFLSLLACAIILSGILCISSIGIAITAESYDPQMMYTKQSANIVFGEDGIHLEGTKDDAGQKWTGEGNYTFNDQFSITYLFDGLPTNNARKDCYTFMKDTVNAGNLLWLNTNITNEGGINSLRVNVTYNDVYMVYDNLLLEGYNFEKNEKITLGYSFTNKTVTISYGTQNILLDLNYKDKHLNGETVPNEKLAFLPENFKISHMTTYGGIIVESINGQSMATIKPVEKVPNLKDDMFTHGGTDAKVAYDNQGALVTTEDNTSGVSKNAFVNSSYNFGNKLTATLRFADLQPAAAGSQKNFFFVVMDQTDNSKQLIINLFAYCTTNDFATSNYILHANIKYQTYEICTSKNLLWDVKDYENYSLTISYDPQLNTVALSSNDGKSIIDLTKTKDDGIADTTKLPVDNLTFYTIVNFGGVYFESINNELLKFNRSEYEVNYTTNKDFFNDETSTAYIGYRNAGVYLSNNAKTSKDFENADSSKIYKFNEYVIMEYKFDCLQTYDSSDPFTIMKGVWFNISDATNPQKQIGIYPFLFKSGNNYILHCNVRIDDKLTYENYYIGYDYTYFENITMLIKYDSMNKTVTLGSTVQSTVIDLAQSFNGTAAKPAPDLSNLPSENMVVDIAVQFGGIFLNRMNQYSFVNPDPSVKDPVDAEIVDFNLPTSTLDNTLSFKPEIKYNDFQNAELKVSYQGVDGQEFIQLIVDENGYYNVTFDVYGSYKFKYELLFDNRKITVLKEVLYQTSSLSGLIDLFQPSIKNSLTIVDEGIDFSNNDENTNLLGCFYGMSTFKGELAVEFKMTSLQAMQSSATFKEVWVDFTDGVNGFWTKVFAFNHPDTNGNYNAFASIFYLPNNDKGAAIKIKENFALGFDFNDGAKLDETLSVVVTYNPYDKNIKIAKKGAEAATFDVSSFENPTTYKLNLTVDYGGARLLALNDFSLMNKMGEITFPSPVIATNIKEIATINDVLTFDVNSSAYDLFDLQPIVEAQLVDPDGTIIPLGDTNIKTSTLNKLGIYVLTFTAKNKRELTSEKVYRINVVNADLENPSIAFADDVFSQLKKGDRDNKYEADRNTEIVMPTPILHDDSGLEVRYKVTVTDPDSSIVTLNNGKFMLSKLGTYRLEYVATDYFGKTSTYTFTIVSKMVQKPDPQPVSKGCKQGCKKSGAAFQATLVLLAFGFIFKMKSKG